MSESPNFTKRYFIAMLMSGSFLRIGKISMKAVQYCSYQRCIDPLVYSEDYRKQLEREGKATAYQIVTMKYLLLNLGGQGLTSKNYSLFLGHYPQLQLPLERMLLFDYLINNLDRHDRNIVWLIHPDKSIVIAPLFDHNQSLLAVWNREDDLQELWEDEELQERFLRNGEDYAKCFVRY